MAEDTTYEYRAIETLRTIRLVHLHPGIETDPIHLSLVTTSLDTAPDFEAISYCWGRAQEEQQVTCNNATLTITNSLFTGLVHFRYPDRPRVVWADAICINQADLAEKSGQVLLMPHIYSQATRTLVWLGIASDPVFGTVSPSVAVSIRRALELLPEIDPEDPADIAAKLEATHLESQRLYDEGKPSLLDHDWVPLVALLERPWFRRKWVVQEVALAKEAMLYIGGGIEIPWPDLAKLAFSMGLLGIQRLLTLKTGNTVLETIAPPVICVTNVLMVQIFRRHATLVDGIVATIDFDCTDPRDHVYSLLSLGAIGPTILPDYHVSVCEVFRRFAVAMLVQGESLKLLSLAPDRIGFVNPDIERLEGLPSWAPDFRLINSDVMVSYTVRPQAFFAGGRSKPIVSVSDDQEILKCQGWLVDTVKTFATSMVEMLLVDIPELRSSPGSLVDPLIERRKKRLARWLESCYHTAFPQTNGSNNADPDDDRMMAFSRTMVCDMDIMRNRLSPEVVGAFPQYMQWAAERVASKQGGTKEQTASMSECSAVIDTSIVAMASWLKFCITENGRFAQIPQTSEVGDCICILVGGEVPFVVRPTRRGTYTIVGECYVDGVMDGEVVEEKRIIGEASSIIQFE
ncbi:heterokaryon incompatibility protein-domain-containing protein [Xylaria bambusicola]|uniref:heterokaryon incompatibility protein-domain-containing protein n=1 Tax=Xylaria bambusicola TaxID=326684 RepID=UPI00200772C9|nr:heterokaryon incompatibility protein-domain-containing protein [Xylaria bambusicola]KAI0515179.1 heterokaryon incompatibility protein-domain-containing protein [Xylaria bambusicola]